jgi:hypothetical protein
VRLVDSGHSEDPADSPQSLKYGFGSQVIGSTYILFFYGSGSSAEITYELINNATSLVPSSIPRILPEIKEYDLRSDIIYMERQFFYSALYTGGSQISNKTHCPVSCCGSLVGLPV